MDNSVSVYSPFHTLMYGVFAALLAVPIAAHFFSEQTLLAASALIALQLGFLMKSVLDENRENIWGNTKTPMLANIRTALQFSGIFCGVFLASYLSTLLFDFVIIVDESYTERFKNDLYPLIFHNCYVMIASFLLSIIYRSGGLLMVLAWNALHWAKSFASYFLITVKMSTAHSALLLISSLLPHLLLEAISYVLAGLAGVFLSLAVQKYSLWSDEFQRVSIAVCTLLGSAFALMFLGSVIEIYLAQAIFHSIM